MEKITENSKVVVFTSIEAVELNHAESYAVKKTKGTVKWFVNDLCIDCTENLLCLSLSLQNGERVIPITVKAIPLESARPLNDHRIIFGKVAAITEGIALASLRIEECAAQHTLMSMNLGLEGKIVLSLGFRVEGSIVYFQTELSELNFAGLFSIAESNGKEVADEEKIALEERYLFMQDINMESEETGVLAEHIVQAEFVETAEAEGLLKFLSEAELQGKMTLLDTPQDKNTINQNVPDSIFKSGAFNKWVHKHAAVYSYSCITYRYAGTDNRESHIVFIEYIDNSSANPHSLSMKMLKNYRVLYVVTNHTLEAKAENRIRVNSLKLQLKSKNEKGVFVNREYLGVQQKSKLDKVIAAAIGWTKHGGKIAASFEALNGKDLFANKSFPFQPTYAKQMALKGEVVSAIEATSKPIRFPNDYFTLKGESSGMTSCSPSRSYTVQYV